MSALSSVRSGDGAVATRIHGLRERWDVPGETVHALGLRLGELLDAGLDELPLPGSGATLERWQALAEVAAMDLGLVKLFESHADALAILAELGAPELHRSGHRWAVWAAEPPGARVQVRALADGLRPGAQVRLDGRKAWCSGAAVVERGLITAWHDGSQHLVGVPMDQDGVEVTDEGWSAVGMAATGSVEIEFRGARGTLVGGEGAYLERPGFWQGGAGVAACWWGAAARLGEQLLERERGRDDPHGKAHLGAVDAALSSGAASLAEAARAIDARPDAGARTVALRTRAVVEDVVERVQRRAGRGLGAGPYCRDPLFARLAADLPVFVRQSHAERDLARLGEDLATDAARAPWRLEP